MTRVQMYPADDVKRTVVKSNKKPKIAKLRNSITPGTVLIILAGRFKGRRVVFLKQLESGLLLVTGPYEVNGVPLRRVNQSYCIATSSKVSLQGLSLDQVNDCHFKKVVQQKQKVDGQSFFVKSNVKTEQDLQNIQRKKQVQVQFDQVLTKNIKA